jgi:hypothetical protein
LSHAGFALTGSSRFRSRKGSRSQRPGGRCRPPRQRNLRRAHAASRCAVGAPHAPGRRLADHTDRDLRPVLHARERVSGGPRRGADCRAPGTRQAPDATRVLSTRAAVSLSGPVGPYRLSPSPKSERGSRRIQGPRVGVQDRPFAWAESVRPLRPGARRTAQDLDPRRSEFGESDDAIGLDPDDRSPSNAIMPGKQAG